MPRDFRLHEKEKKAKARRDLALARRDLREPSVPRAPAAGPFSHAVKVSDPVTAAMVEEFLNRKRDNR